jgi:hypothetical protein
VRRTNNRDIATDLAEKERYPGELAGAKLKSKYSGIPSRISGGTSRSDASARPPMVSNAYRKDKASSKKDVTKSPGTSKWLGKLIRI